MSLVALYKALEDEGSAQHHLEIAQQQIAAQEQAQPSTDFLRLRSLIRMSSGDLAGRRERVKAALAMNPNDPNTLQLTGDVLVKMGRPEEAIAVYRKNSRTGSGKSRLRSFPWDIASREAGHNQEAEKYFLKLAAAIRSCTYLTLPWATCTPRAMISLRRRPHTARPSIWRRTGRLIVAGGMNAAIEGPSIPLAANGCSRASPKCMQEPQVMREKERYLG